MKNVLASLTILLLASLPGNAQTRYVVQPAPVVVQPAPAPAVVAEPEKAPDGKLPRGLKGPTPAAKLLAAPRFSPASNPASFAAAPAQFSVPPPVLRMWGNNQYGCCVSSEEAFALSTWTYYCTKTQVCPSDAEVIAFARKYGYLNGAWLTEVMDTMQQYGMDVGGKNYRVGPYSSVNYTNPTTLQTAIYAGPVNIAIDADALPSGAGNKNGWYATKGYNRSTNHCVGLSGYGPASYLYQTLNMPVPTGLDPATPGYLLFTWSTLGFVTQDWLNSTCTEAWVRVPTTVGFSPPTPTPDPGPTPNPDPTPGPNPGPVKGFTGTITTTQAYKDGLQTGLPTVSVVPATSSGAVEAELQAGGINPAAITAVLKLLRDIRAKEPREVIIADVVALLLALGLGDATAPDPFRMRKE